MSDRLNDKRVGSMKVKRFKEDKSDNQKRNDCNVLYISKMKRIVIV